QNNCNHKICCRAWINNHIEVIHSIKTDSRSKSLDKPKDYCPVTSYLSQLAFTVLAFLLPFRKLRNNIHGKQLNDNGCSNVWCDPQCKDGEVKQCTTGKSVQKAEQVCALLVGHRKNVFVNVRNRYKGTEAI